MPPEIKNYINKQKPPQKEILKKLRRLILKTLPGCDEKAKWGVIAFSENKFYLAAMKDRVHLGFATEGLNKEEIGLFEGSGKTMRHLKIHSKEDIDQKKLTKLIKMVNKKASCTKCR